MVGSVFKRLDTFGNPSDPSVFRDRFEYHFFVRVINSREPVETGEYQQTHLALLFRSLLGLALDGLLPNVEIKESGDSSDIPAWVGEFQKHVKFCVKSLDWRKLTNWHEPTKINDLFPFLFPASVPLEQIINSNLLDSISLDEFDILIPSLFPAGVPLEQIINSNLLDSISLAQFDILIPSLFPVGVPLEQIVHLDRLDPIAEYPAFRSVNTRDTKQLEFWLRRRFENNEKHRDIIRLDTLLQSFSDFPEDILGNKIFGLLNAIYNTMSTFSQLQPGADGWRVVARELVPFLDLLTDKEPETNQERSSLLQAWWQLAWLIYDRKIGGLESELSAQLRKQLV